MQSKKGFVDVLLLTLWALISNPYILLGLGVFLLILILPFYFMLGKVMGFLLVIAGLIMFRYTDWKFAVLMVLLGILVFWNPFGWAKLQMMW